MAGQFLTMSPSYLAMVRGIRDLHRLAAADQDDSAEADAIRDATDGPWESLSEIERRRVRNLSEDMYSLHEPPPLAREMNPQAQAKLNEAIEARQQGDWDRATDLLRRWKSYVDPALVSYLRGSIWLEAGDPETAVLFYEYASKLQPENENSLVRYLHALDTVDSTAAQRRGNEILDDPEKFPPVVVARASEIVFESIRTAPEPQSTALFRRLIPILRNTLARFEQGDASAVDRLSYEMTVGLLGFAHEYLGEAQVALEMYSRGLRFAPANHALLVARGILLYGTSPRAATDFEFAIRYGSPLIWPYFFLAHDHLINGRIEDCRKLCEKALEMNGSNAVKSELSEWLAIAQAELGFPAEIIRAAFETAIRLDPANDRARENLAAFEAATRPIPMTNWKMRTTTAVKTLALAERRYEMAL